MLKSTKTRLANRPDVGTSRDVPIELTAQQKAKKTGGWAVAMTKVRIRQILSRTRWQLITFNGKAGGESVGVVDLLAVRKDHGKPVGGIKRGDALQMILIQVKGGSAADPTPEDAIRGVCQVLLASWKKGAAAIFFSLPEEGILGKWPRVTDLDKVFR